MVRSINSGINHRKHKKILKLAKGFYGCRSRCFRSANQAVIKKLSHSTKDRKKRSNQFRKLWIMRINSVVRQYGLNYSQFMNKIKSSQFCDLNRKIISNMAISNMKNLEYIISTFK